MQAQIQFLFRWLKFFNIDFIDPHEVCIRKISIKFFFGLSSWPECEFAVAINDAAFNIRGSSRYSRKSYRTLENDNIISLGNEICNEKILILLP